MNNEKDLKTERVIEILSETRRNDLLASSRTLFMITSSTISAVLTNPLHRFFVRKQIGIRSKFGYDANIWRGAGLNSVILTSSILIQSSLVSAFRSAGILPEKSAFDHVMAFGLSGIVAETILYPLVRLRNTVFANPNIDSFLDIKKIISRAFLEEGPQGAFKGLSLSLFMIFPFHSIFSATQEQLKSIESPHLRSSLSLFSAALVLYPFDTALKTYQTDGYANSRIRIYSSWTKILLAIKTKGLGFAYRGLPSFIFYFLTNQLLHRMLFIELYEQAYFINDSY